jgi:hypothetical protein
MAATVFLSESNGAGQVVTDNITNINLGSDDAPNLVTLTSPIVIGLNSYRKYIRLKLSALGGSSVIDQIKAYKSAGAYVTGEGWYGNINNGGMNVLAYATPTRAAMSSGGFSLIPTSLPAIAWNIGGVSSGTLTVAGTYSDYWVSVLETTGSTPAGAVNQKTVTVQYNEA